MSKETYSIPQGPTARFDYQRNAIELMTANAPIWGIPLVAISGIVLLQISYVQKYGIANNKNTQSVAATADRDAKWDELAMQLVKLYNQHLINNDSIDAADKAALNIHTGQGRGNFVKTAAITTPVVLLMAEELSVLHVVYTDSASASSSHAKPAGVAFCEVWGKIGGAAPVVPADCVERNNISRSHESIVFDPSQRSKVFYGFARWVNKNGKIGVWGNMFSATIP